MKKFIVLFLAPSATMDEWMKKPEDERKEAETKMKAEWDIWMADHKENVLETAGSGKTKRISPDGVSDVRNDVMMYCIIQANDHDEAANMFVGHPHFGVPGATIEVMTANPIQ